jgi:hypothetical protein
MGCGSSSVSAVNEQLDNVRAAVVTGAGVAAYVVSNAGSPEVQGVYAREGMHEGAPCFRNGVYWLCRNGSEWNIAHKDKVEEGDESFYTVEPEDAEALPEDHGWECGSSGALPLPKIEQVLEGPAKLVVEGAGSTQINGTYERSGTYDGAPRYMKAGGNMCIYRSRGNWYRWMIGDFRKVHETDGDMYKSTSASEYPPLSASSWSAALSAHERRRAARARRLSCAASHRVRVASLVSGRRTRTARIRRPGSTPSTRRTR